jgi:DNA repair photolyase
MITSLWNRPATIERNNFKFKSLSCWSYNLAVGCEHACRFCYVPEVSANRMAGKLKKLGVNDPDAEWGNYVFLRQWNEAAFKASLRKAMALPASELNADGNRAVMLCTTTDPYQTASLRKDELPESPAPTFQQHRRQLVRDALRIILEESDLNVRILTRSPLAREDFALMKQFGNRLLFGMSLPTLNNRLAKIYEPKAPAPTQRLATLKAAREAGLNVYVAVAPVYPDCDARDMETTLRAIKELDPVTVFMEPINIRAENVRRIKAQADLLDYALNTVVFSRPDIWRNYATAQLSAFEAMARSLGIPDSVLHLWPDQSLGSKDARRQFAPDTHNWSNRIPYSDWLEQHWNKVSAWPGITPATITTPPSSL